MAKNLKRFFDRSQKLRGWYRLDQKNPLLYEKECIYADDFAKLDSSGEGLAFAVRRNILEHWQTSLRNLRAAGIKSPLAKSHDTWDQPEDRLGEVVDAEVRENDKGLPSLFLRILFDDEKSRDIGLKGDVSIGSPDVWYDGKKRRWDYPLQHVASTNAPVVPGLEEWRKIAASFANPNTKVETMDLDELITLLGIEVPEDANTDEAKKALIQAKLKEITGGAAPPPAPEDVDMSHEEDEAKRKAAAAAAGGSAGGGAPVPQAKRVTVAFSHDDPTVSMFRDTSHDRVNMLVEQKIITPATAKHINTTFFSANDIAFSLNNKRQEYGKKIIELVKLVAKDRPLKDSGRTEAGDNDDAIELSHSGKAKDVLVKNAEKRRAAAAAR